MKIIFMLFALFSLAGCKSTSQNFNSFASTTFPSIGTVATVGVGDKLLSKSDGISTPAIIIEKDQAIGEFVIIKGKYSQIGKNNEYATFGSAKVKTASGDIDKHDKIYVFDKDFGTKVICISRAICAPVDYVNGTSMAYTKSSFQQTLLYSGKIGNRVTLGYREFSNDVARPAFSNDVAYDISESVILGYKGARLEVIKATNVDITYKVIAGFE
jgi:hypothetical protein